MIKNIRHVGIIVNNLNEAIDFFKKLGFKDYKSDIESGSFISNLVKIDNVKIEWVKLSYNEFIIELLKYHSHPNEKIVQTPQIGSSHIAMTIYDIATAYVDLINDGYSCSKPQKSPDGNVMAMYCYGPDSITIELIEELK